MYYCDRCNVLVEAGKKQNKEVVKTKNRSYVSDDEKHTTYGWEIVKEINVCDDCSGKKPYKEEKQLKFRPKHK